jgi:hypothetical protein
MTTLTVTARGQVTSVTIAGFVGLLAGRTKKVATMQEINEETAQGWAGKE